MKNLFTSLAAAVAVLLLNTFGFAIHASAMPMSLHEMNSKEYGASSLANCTTLCRTAVFNKEEVLNIAREEKEDEPTTPYYALSQNHYFNNIDTNGKLYSVIIKPPPKVPIYILYGVSRS